VKAVLERLRGQELLEDLDDRDHQALILSRQCANSHTFAGDCAIVLRFASQVSLINYVPAGFSWFINDISVF
jgi:hypothetical protein